MSAIITVLFVLLAIFLSFTILIQQGKGEIGLTSGVSQSSQLLFGGSGGATFFEKLTWFLGALFIAGSLLLSLYQTKTTTESVLKGYKVEQTALPTPGKVAQEESSPAAATPVEPVAPVAPAPTK